MTSCSPPLTGKSGDAFGANSGVLCAWRPQKQAKDASTVVKLTTRILNSWRALLKVSRTLAPAKHSVWASAVHPARLGSSPLSLSTANEDY